MIHNFTLLALLQLTISVVVGISFLWITYKLFLRWLNKKQAFEEINVAIAILVSAILWTSGYILTGTLTPLLETLRVVSNNNSTTQKLVLDSAMYIAEFLAVGLVVTLLVNYVSISIFNALTPEKDELKVIVENNIAYAIILSAILVVMSLFAKEAYSALLNSLIPLPQLPSIF